MKTRLILIILAATVILSQSCDRDDDYTPPPLPYFYCKINGQNFAARGGGGCQSRVFNYFPYGFMDALPGTVVIEGYDCILDIQVAFGFSHFNPHQDSLDQNFANLDSIHTLVVSYNNTEPLVFDQVMEGSITFDRFTDKEGEQNGVVSGIFQFKVKNEELDSTVVVTDGRFQYIIDYEWY